jgi:hypothetical protein
MAYFLCSVRSDVPVCRPARAGRVIVVAVTLVASVAAGCRDKRLHVSDAARTKLSGVLTTVQTDVRASCKFGPDGHAFKEIYASTQKQLREIRDDRKSPAEYAAVVLAAQVLYYENGRCDGLATNRPALVAEMESEQQRCLSELKPVLENTVSYADLESSRCLKMPTQMEPVLFGLE